MPDASRETIGFIGTGRMGFPMCRRLLERGVPLLMFNRTPDRARPLLQFGGALVPDVAHLAQRCRVIVTCLDTVEGTEALYGERLVPNARAGTLLIDHATITPDLARRIGRMADAAGMQFVDAPVSGGPEGAEKGTLAIMVGGEGDAFERALPVMGSYGALVKHMGPVASGTLTKLVNQLLTFAHGAAAAEAIALAQRVGLELPALGALIGGSFGHSRMFDRTLGRVTAGQYEAGAALQLFMKDLGIVQDAGSGAGLEMPVTAAMRDWLSKAVAAGNAGRDIAALRLMYPDS